MAENFLYLEKLIGPLDKEQYLKKFGEEYYLRDGMPDLDLRLTNFRVDPYDPYRVWVDSSPRGVRIGNIGKRSLPRNVDALPYQGPPESISFTFDDDGFCTRYTSAAVLDPLLGNTGGLGGIYGILEATGTAMNPLLTRSLNEFLSRASKSVLSSADTYKLSDGRLVNEGLPPSRQPLLSSQSTKTTEIALPLPPKMPPVPPSLPTKPFFAAETVEQPERSPTISLPKTDNTKPADVKVGNNSSNKAQELRNAAQAARSEAAEAKKRALERKQAVLDQERRLADEKKKEAIEAERKNKEKQAEAIAKAKQQQAKNVSRPSPKAPSPRKSPKKQSPPSPAVSKRSPTINLFDSFSGSTKSTSSNSKPKEASVIKGSEVKRSPTLSLFGSSSEKKKTTQSKSMPKKISKKAKVAKSSTVKSPVINQSRPTISLFGLGGSTDSSSSSLDIKKSTPKVTKTISSAKAPRDVPTISKWKYDQSDKTIVGFISGSGSKFKDGTPITTSTIVGDKVVESNTVVRTTSGSKYFLAEEDTTKTGGIFSFFSDSNSESKAPTAVTPALSKQSSSSNKAAELKQKKQKADAERKRKLDELALEKKRKMDEVKAKKEAQIKAKKEAAAIAKAKQEKSALEKSRKMEEAKAKREALKKQSQSQVVNKKSTPPGKSPTLTLFGTGQPNKEETQIQVMKRQQTKQPVKGSGTFSLFGSSTAATKKSTSSSTATRAVKKTSQKKPFNLFGGGSDPAPTTPKQKEVEKKQSSFGFFGASKGSSSSSTITLKSSSSQGGRLNKKKVPAKKPIAKKDNIPILSRFTQNSDGSLTGIVSNSKDFRSGTKITTSPIKGKAVAGIVVKTSSGSQYRLQ